MKDIQQGSAGKIAQSRGERLAVAVLGSVSFALLLAAVILTWDRQEPAAMRILCTAALIFNGIACGIYWNRFFSDNKK